MTVRWMLGLCAMSIAAVARMPERVLLATYSGTLFLLQWFENFVEIGAANAQRTLAGQTHGRQLTGSHVRAERLHVNPERVGGFFGRQKFARRGGGLGGLGVGGGLRLDGSGRGAPSGAVDVLAAAQFAHQAVLDIGEGDEE